MVAATKTVDPARSGSGGGGAEAAVWRALEQVMDPEIPVISVVELGIVRSVRVVSTGSVTVTITPTYSGCPAMRVIEDEIRAALTAAGWSEVSIATVHAPAWTTDWLDDGAREKLRKWGIAPPPRVTTEAGDALVPLRRAVATTQCPFCGSYDTVLRSEFGSTACKSLLFCEGCHQPFELFKAL